MTRGKRDADNPVRKRAIELRHDYGWTYKQIAMFLGFKESTVYYWCNAKQCGAKVRNWNARQIAAANLVEAAIAKKKEMPLPVSFLLPPSELRKLTKQELMQGKAGGYGTQKIREMV